MKESKFYQEIMEEGAQEASRKNILEILEHRFGAPARKKVRSTVNSITDLAELERLFRVAISCEDLDEFRSALAD